MTALEGFSQTDTICVPRKDLIKKLIQIENLKLDSLEGAQAKGEAARLQELSISKDVTIRGLDAHINTLKSQVDVFAIQKLDYANQLIDKDRDIHTLEKTVRKEKRKHLLTKAAGVIVIGGLVYLLFTQ